jgi:hypothetical protein
MLLKDEAPGSLAGGHRGGSALAGGFAANHSSPIDVLLPRLDAVRRVGRGWVARCPSHEDRSPSLAIDVGADGETLLIHCFAGCVTADVLAAVGLSLSDLFPRHSGREGASPQHRQRIAPETGWRAALSTVIKESTIIQIAASDLTRGVLLSEEDRARVAAAAAKIEAAWEVLYGHRRA